MATYALLAVPDAEERLPHDGDNLPRPMETASNHSYATAAILGGAILLLAELQENSLDNPLAMDLAHLLRDCYLRTTMVGDLLASAQESADNAVAGGAA